MGLCKEILTGREGRTSYTKAKSSKRDFVSRDMDKTRFGSTRHEVTDSGWGLGVGRERVSREASEKAHDAHPGCICKLSL